MAMNQDDSQKFGDYVLEQKLGIGGMASVYLTTHTTTERQVALKILHEQFVDDETAVRRFERESNITKTLKHPHIVPVLAFGKTNNRPYLVMPYYENGTLAEYLRKPRKMRRQTILKVLKVLAEGLDYAHKHDVIHRDFKLENILLDKNNTPVISDFGIAQIANTTRLTATGNFVGTPYYMAPEQATKGSDGIDHRADLYAFAVVAYLLLTGVFPFTSTDPFQLILKHNTQPPPTPSIINPKLNSNVDAVIIRGMAKRPFERYRTATEFVDALEHAFSHMSPMTTLIDISKMNPADNTGQLVLSPVEHDV